MIKRDDGDFSVVNNSGLVFYYIIKKYENNNHTET